MARLHVLFDQQGDSHSQIDQDDSDVHNRIVLFLILDLKEAFAEEERPTYRADNRASGKNQGKGPVDHPYVHVDEESN